MFMFVNLIGSGGRSSDLFQGNIPVFNGWDWATH